MQDKIAIVEGIRTPFCKAGGSLAKMQAEDLGAYIVKELVAKVDIDKNIVDELIFGNVFQSLKSANIARVIAYKAGLPDKMPSYTVNRNCASGLEAILSAAEKIALQKCNVVIAGGTESMSNIPIAIKDSYKDFLMQLFKAKTLQKKLSTLLSFRLKMLMPDFPSIADPLSGLSMGETAENLAREFKIDRNAQDQFALLSQQRAFNAQQGGRFLNEVHPLIALSEEAKLQTHDDGVRSDQKLAHLQALKPAFNKLTGTVTAGTSSQVSDGAAALLLMRESVAKNLGLKPLGFIIGSAEVGLDPARMGLGPAFAISKLLQKTSLTLNDIDLFEINEAFAAQVLACVKALSLDTFCQKELGLNKALGTIDLEILNVNGGAIALGHPLGATGARLVITILKELKRRKKRRGIASLCIGGGQGQAVLLEVE